MRNLRRGWQHWHRAVHRPQRHPVPAASRRSSSPPAAAARPAQPWPTQTSPRSRPRPRPPSTSSVRPHDPAPQRRRAAAPGARPLPARDHAASASLPAGFSSANPSCLSLKRGLLSRFGRFARFSGPVRAFSRVDNLLGARGRPPPSSPYCRHPPASASHGRRRLVFNCATDKGHVLDC